MKGWLSFKIEMTIKFPPPGQPRDLGSLFYFPSLIPIRIKLHNIIYYVVIMYVNINTIFQTNNTNINIIMLLTTTLRLLVRLSTKPA